MRSLWAMVQDDPSFMRRTNGWLTLAWVAMIPVTLVTGLIGSVEFIAAASIYANVASHWAAWQASRVEERQEQLEQERQEREA